MSKTVKRNDCIEYTGGISSTGYGVFWLNRKSENAHKASYILNVGDIPNGMWVLHTCDNKKCINPCHLYIGTSQDNSNDAVERGRIATGSRHGSKTKPRNVCGENNPFSKVSNENCIAIAKARSNGVSMAWIASNANIHLSTAYRANIRGKSLITELNKTK